MDTACRGGPRDADTLPIQTSMEGRRRWLRAPLYLAVEFFGVLSWKVDRGID